MKILGLKKVKGSFFKLFIYYICCYHKELFVFVESSCKNLDLESGFID